VWERERQREREYVSGCQVLIYISYSINCHCRLKEQKYQRLVWNQQLLVSQEQCLCNWSCDCHCFSQGTGFSVTKDSHCVCRQVSKTKSSKYNCVHCSVESNWHTSCVNQFPLCSNSCLLSRLFEVNYDPKFGIIIVASANGPTYVQYRGIDDVCKWKCCGAYVTAELQSVQCSASKYVIMTNDRL